MRGRLIGVGVGPGDPEHLTLKALRTLREADRVFAPAGGRAEAVVAEHVAVQRLDFAMSDAPSRDERWDRAGAAIADVVLGGGTAAFVTLGDPNLYSTFTYIAQTVRALVPDVLVETVPGITAMQDLAARSGIVLAEGAEPLSLLPLAAGDDGLREALAGGGTVVCYKGGRRLPAVLGAIAEAQRLDHAVYGADLGGAREEVGPATAVTDRTAPYFSTVIVPAQRDGTRGGKLT